MIPAALKEAFGVAEYDDIAQITKGQTSSQVFRVVVRGTPYLLKVITRAEDPTRHYMCMKAAAEAGLAPRVWYTNVENKISITDFVEAKPLSSAEARVRLPKLLRELHALTRFARAPFNTTCTFLLKKDPMLDGYLDKFRKSNLVDTKEFFARYEELAAVYPYDDAEMVASHNDLFKPDNILFDGERVLLVDWEAAFLNDRYADLAAVANQVVMNDEEEAAFLREYFGAEANAYQRARFHLMQQIAHLFYAMAFLTIGSGNDAVPGYEEFQRRFWAGEIGLRDKDAQFVYGKVHWARLLHNVRQERYRDALRTVAGARS